MSVRPGPMGCLGLRELHMVPYSPPTDGGRDTKTAQTRWEPSMQKGTLGKSLVKDSLYAYIIYTPNIWLNL